MCDTRQQSRLPPDHLEVRLCGDTDFKCPTITADTLQRLNVSLQPCEVADPWQLKALCRSSHLHKCSPVVFHTKYPHYTTLEMRESCIGAERHNGGAQCEAHISLCEDSRIRQM